MVAARWTGPWGAWLVTVDGVCFVGERCMGIYREPVAWSAVAMKRFWDILDRPRWRGGSTVRYGIDRLVLVLWLADVVCFRSVLGIFYVWHWTLFAAVLLVGVAAQIAADAPARDRCAPAGGDNRCRGSGRGRLRRCGGTARGGLGFGGVAVGELRRRALWAQSSQTR